LWGRKEGEKRKRKKGKEQDTTSRDSRSGFVSTPFPYGPSMFPEKKKREKGKRREEDYGPRFDVNPVVSLLSLLNLDCKKKKKKKKGKRNGPEKTDRSRDKVPVIWRAIISFRRKGGKKEKGKKGDEFVLPVTHLSREKRGGKKRKRGNQAQAGRAASPRKEKKKGKGGGQEV